MVLIPIAVPGNPILLFHTAIGRYRSEMEPPKQLSQEAIEEFKAIYRDEFGMTLSDPVAREMAIRLLRLFYILLQRLPSK